MSHGHITYTEIDPKQRQEAAAKAIANLKTLLVNPAITQEQRDLLLEKIQTITAWAQD